MYRLDVSRFPGVVVESLADLGHGACKGVVGDRHIGPDSLENLVFGHRPVAVFDQELKQAQRFRLQRPILPFAVSRRFKGSKTNWPKRYRPSGNPIMISSPAFGNKSDPDHDLDGPQAAWWPHVNTRGSLLTHDNPRGAA